MLHRRLILIEEILFFSLDKQDASRNNNWFRLTRSLTKFLTIAWSINNDVSSSVAIKVSRSVKVIFEKLVLIPEVRIRATDRLVPFTFHLGEKEFALSRIAISPPGSYPPPKTTKLEQNFFPICAAKREKNIREVTNNEKGKKKN